MRLVLILLTGLTLAGCNMSIEEYNARVKYCEENGMDTKIYLYNNTKKVAFVDCVNKDGLTFESKGE